jgi:hypothetical protein
VARPSPTPQKNPLWHAESSAASGVGRAEIHGSFSSLRQAAILRRCGVQPAANLAPQTKTKKAADRAVALNYDSCPRKRSKPRSPSQCCCFRLAGAVFEITLAVAAARFAAGGVEVVTAVRMVTPAGFAFRSGSRWMPS